MRIKEISIKRFRGIKDQTITDIDNALVLIGKNNSGKSAVLTAIRLFFGNYSSKEKDFYKQCDDFEIAIRFYVDDEYLLDYFLDNKIGYAKVPSKAAEFNETKEGTVFADNNYNEYKEERDNCIEHFFEDEGTRERFEPIWLKAIKKKFAIENNSLTVVLSCRKNDLKPIYSINDVATKDISVLFPDVAFIDDTRYTVKYILGDADDNGCIDIIDATFIQRKLADLDIPYTDEILQQGDADGSGELDVIDVTMIQRYLVDLKTPYLVGADVV